MHLAYLDESYKDDRDTYWIGAVIVTEDRIRPLSDALDGIVARAARDYPEAGLHVDARTELHAYPLFHGRGIWKPLHRLVRARVGIYRAALEAINEHATKIVLRGVDVPGLRARYITPWHRTASFSSSSWKRLTGRRKPPTPSP